MRLFVPGGPKHCGIEVHDTRGVTYYHIKAPHMGFGDRCVFGSNRITAPFTDRNDYWIETTWSDPTGRLCECIHARAAALSAANLRYAPIPQNRISYCPCHGFSTESTCNSNYATHCLMRSCGIGHRFGFLGTPIGWNHRMRRCVEYVAIGRQCGCRKWEYIDQEWCNAAPESPDAHEW